MNYMGGLGLKENQYVTSIGVVSIISFEDFLSTIPTEKLRGDNEQIIVNQQTDVSIFGGEAQYEGVIQEFGPYERRIIRVEYINKKDLSLEIYKQSKIVKINRKPMRELVEDIAMEYCAKYVNGDIMLVELKPNVYMPAQERDYKIVHNNGKCNLIINCLPRCMVFQVSKFDNSKYIVGDKNE